MCLKNVLITVPVTAAAALLTNAAISTALGSAVMIVPVKIQSLDIGFVESHISLLNRIHLL